jgi:hypothetical protein
MWARTVCKNYLPNDTKAQSIKCEKCGMITEDVFNEIQVPKQAQEVCLGNIFEFIESETSSKLNELKSIKKFYFLEIFKFLL